MNQTGHPYEPERVREDTSPDALLTQRLVEEGVANIARRDSAYDECQICQAALPGYLLADWPPVDQLWIDQHLQTCHDCQRLWKQFCALGQLLDHADDDLPEAPPVLLNRRRQHSMKPVAAYGRITSPIGDLSIAMSETGVCDIGFAWMENEEQLLERLRKRGFEPVPDQQRITAAAEQLQDYFAGKREEFSVPLDLTGLTPFTQSVLDATYAVPFGETRTYLQIAQAIGRPKATRAVGNALHRNPIPLIVPCHRILGTSAKFSLGGYAGGLETKTKLLRLEGVLHDTPTLFS